MSGHLFLAVKVMRLPKAGPVVVARRSTARRLIALSLPLSKIGGDMILPI
jgi:hypothetical protein